MCHINPKTVFLILLQWPPITNINSNLISRYIYFTKLTLDTNQMWFDSDLTSYSSQGYFTYMKIDTNTEHHKQICFLLLLNQLFKHKDNSIGRIRKFPSNSYNISHSFIFRGKQSFNNKFFALGKQHSNGMIVSVKSKCQHLAGLWF